MSSESNYAFLGRDSYAVFTLLPPMKDAAWGDIEASGNEVLKELEDRQYPPLVVDLSEMDYMGSSVVALLVRVWKTTSAHSGKMAVVNRHPLVLEVLELAGLTKVWTVVDSMETALDDLEVSDAAVVVKRETRMLAMVGPVAVVASLAGALTYWKYDSGVQEYFGLITLFGCAGLSAIASCISIVRERGLGRIVSLTVFLASLGIIGWGSMLYADRTEDTEADEKSNSGAIYETTVTGDPTSNEQDSDDRNESRKTSYPTDPTENESTSPENERNTDESTNPAEPSAQRPALQESSTAPNEEESSTKPESDNSSDTEAIAPAVKPGGPDEPRTAPDVPDSPQETSPGVPRPKSTESDGSLGQSSPRPEPPPLPEDR